VTGTTTHHVIVIMAVPAGMPARRETPFGDDHPVIFDLDGRLGERAFLVGFVFVGHGGKLMTTRAFVR